MREYLMAIREFAKLLGMSIKTYSGWENEYSKPTLEKALKVVKKLNRDVKDIWYLE